MRGSMLTFSVIVAMALAIGLVAFLLPGVTTLAQRPVEVAVPPLEQPQLVISVDSLPLEPSSGFTELAGTIPAARLLNEDPERAAEEFVERTRQEVDAAIRALTEEAEALRARLQRVEARLGRWQAVLHALDASQAPVIEPMGLDAPEIGFTPAQN